MRKGADGLDTFVAGAKAGPPMKLGRPFRTLIAFFALVLALYLASFHGVEYLRHRKGPWSVRFDRTADGTPFAEIFQPRLGITGVRLVFPGETFTNSVETLAFALPEPSRTVPFGRVIYEDLTFLPGVVTFDFFGHEIELVPRMLVVNRKAIPWRSGAEIEVARASKPASPPQPPATTARKPSLFAPRP